MSTELTAVLRLRDTLNRHVEQLEKYAHLFATLERQMDRDETLVLHGDMGDSWTLYRDHTHSDYVVEKNQEQVVAVDDLTVALLVLVLSMGGWLYRPF